MKIVVADPIFLPEEYKIKLENWTEPLVVDR
jgi:hypothetical protein